MSIRKLNLALLLCIVFSCSNTPRMELTGRVNDLKKGTIYLQKIQDSTLIVVDSVSIDGEPDFNFSTPISSPEVFYLTLKKNDTNSLIERMPFFAEAKPMSITTSLSRFGVEATITGSENQAKLEQYQKILKRYQDRNLEYIEHLLEAQTKGDTAKTAAITNQQDKLLARKYLATVNFALQNASLEVAPYLLISDAYGVNRSLADTVYKSLTPKVKTSLYGKMLDAYIQQLDSIN